VQWVVAAFVVQRTLGYPALRQFTIGWESFVAAVGMGITVLIVQSWLEFLPRAASLGVLVVIGVVVHMVLLAILAPKLAKRFVDFGAALARRDRKGMTRILGLSS
jgi:hypothetical protein